MSKKATTEILRMVNDIVKYAPKGEAFFDALDEQLSSTSNRWLITDAINMAPKNHTLILSGGFGKTVADLIDSGWIAKRNYVLFKGGVRKGGAPTIIRQTKELDKRASFIDDSIYGGVTYFSIRDYIKSETKIPVPTKCIAIYDGCPVQRKEVKSLFRYYDFFKAKPNFKF
jgi:hypothetical protein